MRVAADGLLPCALVGVGVLEQAQLEFHGQYPPHDLIDALLRDLPRLNQVGHRLAPEGVRVIQPLHVQAIVQRQLDGVAIGGHQFVVVFNARHAAPVRAGVALHVEAVVQHLFQIVLGGHQHVAVHAVVADHHVIRARLANGRLEHRQIAPLHLARARAGGRAIGAALGDAVDAIVFRFADHGIRAADVALLLAGNDGHRHAGGEVGVLAERLLHPPPARVARHVQIRRQNLLHAKAARLAADRLADLANERRVERRAEIDRAGEDCAAQAADPVQRLTGEDYRDAEAAVLHKEFLQPVLHRRDGVVVVQKAGTGVAAQRQQVVKAVICVQIDAAMVPFRAFGGIVHAADHVGLRRLFGGGHAGEQILHPLRHRQRRVFILGAIVHASLLLFGDGRCHLSTV